MTPSDKTTFVIGQVFGVAGLLLCLSFGPEKAWFGAGVVCLIGAWLLTLTTRESSDADLQRIGEGHLRDWRRIKNHPNKLLNVETGDVINAADIRDYMKTAGPVDIGEVHIGKKVTGDVIWWGWVQWYKWRWHGEHIDLGPVSVYNLRRLWFWKAVAFLIYPLRWCYDRFRVT